MCNLTMSLLRVSTSWIYVGGVGLDLGGSGSGFGGEIVSLGGSGVRGRD